MLLTRTQQRECHSHKVLSYQNHLYVVSNCCMTNVHQLCNCVFSHVTSLLLLLGLLAAAAAAAAATTFSSFFSFSSFSVVVVVVVVFVAAAAAAAAAVLHALEANESSWESMTTPLHLGCSGLEDRFG